MSTAEISLGTPGCVFPDLLEQLKAALAPIHGLPYLFARTTYGNELTLHFGTERSHAHPKLTGRIRGTHVLSVRGSAWLLRSGIKPVMVGCGVFPVMPPQGGVKPFNVTALESGALIKQGATVTQVVPFDLEPLSAIGVTVELSDGSCFTVLPTPPDKEGDDLPEPADWELLTPAIVLRVGPGLNYAVEENGPRRV